MKILPQGFRVYIKLDPVEEVVVNGIILPAKHKEQSRIGTVKAIGTDVEEYKIGDRVLIQFYAGVALHLVREGISDDTHRIMNVSNILAIVEE